jgi:hypothetical protein
VFAQRPDPARRTIYRLLSTRRKTRRSPASPSAMAFSSIAPLPCDHTAGGFRELPQRPRAVQRLKRGSTPALAWHRIRSLGELRGLAAVSSTVQGDDTAHLGRIGRSVPSVARERCPDRPHRGCRWPRRAPHRRERDPRCRCVAYSRRWLMTHERLAPAIWASQRRPACRQSRRLHAARSRP